MKKIKDIKKWKRYFLRKQRKALKRKQNKNRRRKLPNQKINKEIFKAKTGHYKGIRKRHKHLEIKAPTNFSLINNIEETLWFFDEIHSLIKKGKSIFLDLKDVKELTTDAILYMLSHIEYCKSRGRTVSFTGNFPSDEKCAKIFRTSGFFKYVYYAGGLQTDPSTFSIEAHSEVMPVTAQAVKNFAVNSIERTKVYQKGLYKNMIECMANTKQHAYKSHIHYFKWWVMASFDKDSKKVHFTFLDNGLGIPSTIRKNFRDYIRGIVKPQDGELIYSALKGQFRTQTGESYRGKGLPEIYKTVQEKKIEDLVIISKKGYVNASKGMVRELQRTFYGTLLSWDAI